MPDAPLRPCRVSSCNVLGPCAEHDAPRARQERETKPAWSAWYHIARWRNPIWGLRTRALAAHPVCATCRASGRIVATTQIDHVIPHRGDPALFWNMRNLQGLCDACHAEKTARGE